MKDLKKSAFSRAHKISNPIPWEKRIFLCSKCRDHKYMVDLAENNVCKGCYESVGKVDQKTPEGPGIQIGHLGEKPETSHGEIPPDSVNPDTRGGLANSIEDHSRIGTESRGEEIE